MSPCPADIYPTIATLSHTVHCYRCPALRWRVIWSSVHCKSKGVKQMHLSDILAFFFERLTPVLQGLQAALKKLIWTLIGNVGFLDSLALTSQSTKMACEYACRYCFLIFHPFPVLTSSTFCIQGRLFLKGTKPIRIFFDVLPAAGLELGPKGGQSLT